MSTSVVDEEIQNFRKDSAKWWDESGPFATLHKLNPVRMEFILNAVKAHFGAEAPSGLAVLDIGCGGGLVCEPMARLGAQVTGIDADENAIVTAKAHSDEMGLKISYQSCAAETLAEKGETFDVVLALEIIEHVNDPAGFLGTCAKLLKPGGTLIVSTLNRTPKSYALGIIAAERILRWVPQGTHDWKKFIRPSELSKYGRAHGMQMKSLQGLIYHPLRAEFTLSKTDLDVNYFAVFEGNTLLNSNK